METNQHSRIIAIQNWAGALADGDPGPETQTKTWRLANLALSQQSTALLEKLNALYEIDALKNPNLLRALLWNDVRGLTPDFDPNCPALLSEKGIKMILKFEGIDQPGHWPQFQSGITIGYGYDLGYTPVSRFVADWSQWLTPAQMTLLKTAIGIKGTAARDIQSRFRGIQISPISAHQVFSQRTIPYWYTQTMRPYWGFHQWIPDAQASLVSVCFNRGTDITDERGSQRRREMRELTECIIPPDYKRAAVLFDSMTRLWVDNIRSDGDLYDRRVNEAENIRTAAGINEAPSKIKRTV